MKNRNIRYLYVKSTIGGSYYIPKENINAETINLINDNLEGFAAISRLNFRNKLKAIKEFSKGKTAKAHFDYLGNFRGVSYH